MAPSVPNLLSLSRIPLAVVLFVLIHTETWPASLGVFLLSAFTDWLDGWWARRYNCGSALGRALDPLTDKVLVCGAFIALIPFPFTGVAAWMVAVVVSRELLVTGLRGLVESTGKAFGADWFGKLKTVLQMAALVAVFTVETLRPHTPVESLVPIRTVLLWGMLGATLGSLGQYTVKAARALR